MTRVPIRLADGADPDTGDPCRVLEINGRTVPFWPDPADVTAAAAQIAATPGAEEPLLLRLLDGFLGLVQRCINRRLTLTEIMAAVEAGWVEVGPPPEET